MATNWRLRFLAHKDSRINVTERTRAILADAEAFMTKQRETLTKVGTGGAKTAYCRFNASDRHMYPMMAKFNFAIIDAEGRKRFLTAMECDELGFDFYKGTSDHLSFIKNFNDPFYAAHRKAYTEWNENLWNKYKEMTDEARMIQQSYKQMPWRTEIYKEYLQSPEWYVKRQRVLKRDGYTCQLCGVDTGLQVHHLTYNRVGDEALFDLVTLCFQCHKKEHPIEG